MCSAEFDIFLFITFKRNIELLFWSKVFNPFCIFLLCTLEVTELRRKKKFKNRSGSHVTNKIYVVSFSPTHKEQLSWHPPHLSMHPLSCVDTISQCNHSIYYSALSSLILPHSPTRHASPLGQELYHSSLCFHCLRQCSINATEEIRDIVMYFQTCRNQNSYLCEEKTK